MVRSPRGCRPPGKITPLHFGSMPDQPHSAEFFGSQRDYWWNRDFLDLMAGRWGLGQASTLADIGCGLCHWSRLLFPYLQKPARVTGIDRETRWLAESVSLCRK